MQETWHCPICGDKMRGIKHKNTTIYFLEKTSDYSERICSGLNHCIQIYVDEQTNQVDLLKLSLNPTYDRFIFIDFFNQKCKVVCLKNNQESISINIPKMIEPDFPELLNLKDRVSMFICFT